MAEIEGDHGLNAEGIRDRRIAVAREALAKLNALSELGSAESVAARRLERLREKQQAELSAGKPRDVAEAQISGEIRAYVKAQKAPALAAMALKHDRHAVQAILSAPPATPGRPAAGPFVLTAGP